MAYKGIDASQVKALGVDLRNAPGRKAVEIRRSMFRAGMNMKKQAAQIIADARFVDGGKTNIPAYPYAIDFDQLDGGFTIEVGPNKDKNQGPLGNIFEYGGEDFAPIPHLQPALDAEAPRSEKALADIASDLL